MHNGTGNEFLTVRKKMAEEERSGYEKKKFKK